MKKNILIAVWFILSLSCSKQSTTIMPAKGSVMIRYDGGNNIFVTDDFVDVMIENKNYRIKNGFGLSGKCGTNDDYTLSLDLAQGIYSYTAKTQIGRNLKGEVSVKSGYCTTVLLK